MSDPTVIDMFSGPEVEYHVGFREPPQPRQADTAKAVRFQMELYRIATNSAHSRRSEAERMTTEPIEAAKKIEQAQAHEVRAENAVLSLTRMMR